MRAQGQQQKPAADRAEARGGGDQHASITEWVSAEPANPSGAIARTVRAQRISCRHNPRRLGSLTRFSTR